MVCEHMVRLIDLFESHCEEKTTLESLRVMAKDHRSWPKGHSLFDSIRRKNLCAIAAKNSVLESQYCFEEVCAETLYNLSGPADPFDPDTPYWIVPNAFALARYLGIDRGRVVEIVAAEPVAPRDAPKSGAPLS